MAGKNEDLKIQLQPKEIKNKGTQASKEQISGQISSEPAKIEQGLDLSYPKEDGHPGCGQHKIFFNWIKQNKQG